MTVTTGVKGKLQLGRFGIAYLNMALTTDFSLALCVDLQLLSYPPHLHCNSLQRHIVCLLCDW